MAKILGLPFDDYVKKQIEVRQTRLAKTQKDSEDLVVFNSNTSWVRLSSGVKIEPDKATTLSDKLGVNVSLIQGNSLAKNLVLWGGISSFSTGSKEISLDPLKGGVGYGLNNAYGFLSNSSQGLQPPPGIQNISCNYKNNGALKQAQVKLKCFTRSQFEAIEAVYLRLGYTMVLEWGNTLYFNNNNQKSSISSYSIPNILFSNDQDVNPDTIQTKLNSNKINTGGNYDGMVAKVTNYSWNIQNDLSFDITIDLISVGDIIDSLKVNIGGATETSPLNQNINFSGSINNIASIQLNKNVSKLNNFFYELYEELYKPSLKVSDVSGETIQAIEEADKVAEIINNGDWDETKKSFDNALVEFRKYYTLFNEGLEIFKIGTIGRDGTFLSSSNATSEQQKRYFEILNELFSYESNKSLYPAKALSMFDKEKEKKEGADVYNACLNSIETFINNKDISAENIEKLVAITKVDKISPKNSIINALERGNLGSQANSIEIEGSEYDDGAGDFNFTDIIEGTFGIDG